MKDQQTTYDDIRHLPRHVSKKRPQMPVQDRATQFAPFAAVVGHQAAIKETERLTDARPDLDDMEKALIDQELQWIEAQLPEPVKVKIIYFEPDKLKSGGHFVHIEDQVKKIDPEFRVLVLQGGLRIGFEALISLSVPDRR